MPSKRWLPSSIMLRNSLTEGKILHIFCPGNVMTHQNFVAALKHNCNVMQKGTQRQLRARRALLQIKDLPLRTRRALSPYTLYSNSALLVLNGTSLNCNNALLALNWRQAFLSINHGISFQSEDYIPPPPPDEKCQCQFIFIIHWNELAKLRTLYKQHSFRLNTNRNHSHQWIPILTTPIRTPLPGAT